MRAFFSLTLSVVRLYLRDRLTVVLTLALTVFMMVVFALVMGEDQFQVALPVAVVDHANNDASREFLARIAKDDLLKLKPVEVEADIDEAIRRADVIGGFVLEPQFNGRRDADQHVGGISLVTSQHSTTWTRLGLERLQRLVESPAGNNADAGWNVVAKPIEVVKNRYIDFIFPGVLAMALMQACLASGVVMLQARAIGVLRRLRLTPAGSLRIFLAFICGRMLVVSLQLAVLTAVAVLGFGVNILSSWPSLALAVIGGSVTFMTLGLMVAIIAPSLEAGNLMVQALSFPMSFLCGVFFKLDHVPTFLAWIAKALPLTYLVNAMRGLITLGLPVHTFQTDFAVLGGWFVGALIIGAMAFHYLQRDEA